MSAVSPGRFPRTSGRKAPPLWDNARTQHSRGRLYLALALRNLALDLFAERCCPRRQNLSLLRTWPRLWIAFGDPAILDLLGLLGNRWVLASPAIEMEGADPQHGLDLWQRVREAFQRRRQPHHIRDAGEVARVLYHAALLRERRIVVSPYVADGPILRFWSRDAERGHKRVERGDIALKFLSGDLRCLFGIRVPARPGRVIERTTASRMRCPYRQAAERLRMDQRAVRSISSTTAGISSRSASLPSGM